MMVGRKLGARGYLRPRTADPPRRRLPAAVGGRSTRRIGRRTRRRPGRRTRRRPGRPCGPTGASCPERAVLEGARLVRSPSRGHVGPGPLRTALAGGRCARPSRTAPDRSVPRPRDVRASRCRAPRRCSRPPSRGAVTAARGVLAPTWGTRSTCSGSNPAPEGDIRSGPGPPEPRGPGDRRYVPLRRPYLPPEPRAAVRQVTSGLAAVRSVAPVRPAAPRRSRGPPRTLLGDDRPGSRMRIQRPGPTDPRGPSTSTSRSCTGLVASDRGSAVLVPDRRDATYDRHAGVVQRSAAVHTQVTGCPPSVPRISPGSALPRARAGSGSALWTACGRAVDVRRWRDGHTTRVA